MSSISKDKRITIGMSVDSIQYIGGKRALQGILKAVREYEVNLICFHLNLSKREMPIAWLSMGEFLNGLIIYQSWQESMFNEFRSHFPGLPVVNVLRQFPGYPGLLPDSYEGMKKLIGHLINSHGCRKIAFLRGPENNFSSDERYRGYLDILKENDIKIDPGLITPNLSWDDGRKGIDILIDERGLKPGNGFDAVAGANDALAIDVMERLHSRGTKVPADVKVVGFDDSSRASFSIPPLTTAGYELGKSAVEILMKMLKGENIPDKTFVTPEIVIRRSCGCIYSSVMHACALKSKGHEKQKGLNELTQEKREEIICNMVQSLDEDKQYENDTAEKMRQIFSSFINILEPSGGETENTFLNTLENVIFQEKSEKYDLHVWQNVLSMFRNELLPYLSNDNQCIAENLLQQARLLIEEMVYQDLERKQNRVEEKSKSVHEIETALLTNFSITGLMNILKEKLPSLGIKSCYLVLYDEPGYSKLVLAYDNYGQSSSGSIINKNGGVKFKSAEFLPEGVLPDRQASFITEPLHFQEHDLGYILFETFSAEAAVFGRLRSTISSALQGALLLEQVSENTEQLNMIVSQTLTTSEEMQATLSETSSQLQVVSDSAKVSMNVSEDGQVAVSKTIAGMELIQGQVGDIASSITNLSKQISHIEDIINTVEDIVSRSEILAINASIQAARAGKQGLEFSVVAREMRKLADQSGVATANITGILNDIRKAAANAVTVTEKGSKGALHGMELAGHAGEAIKELSLAIEKSAKMAIQISTSTKQQVNAMNELVRSVQSIKEANKETSVRFREAGL